VIHRASAEDSADRSVRSFEVSGVDAGELGEYRDYVDSMFVSFFHDSTSSCSAVDSFSTRVRCSLFNFFGTVMFTVTNRSPAACLPAAGTPRPRTRIVVPGCVPAAIFKVTGSSSVGTSTVVPSMTAVSGTFTDVVTLRALRSKRASG